MHDGGFQMFEHVKDKATWLLATHCCICSTPLRDAKSVEMGIGPICRKRYAKADVETTPEMLQKALGALVMSGLDSVVVDAVLERKGDARTVCNWLVYFASAHYTDKPKVLSVTPIIRLLGYTTLADKLEKDRSRVILTNTPDGWVEVECPRNEMLARGASRLGAQMRRHPSSGRFKCWAFPADQKPSLALLLGVAYPNEYCFVDGTTFVIDAATWQTFLASLPTKVVTAPTNTNIVPTGKVWAEDKGTYFVLHTPYNPGFVGAVRSVRGRRYEGGDANSFPMTVKPDVANLVHQFYGVAL